MFPSFINKAEILIYLFIVQSFRAGKIADHFTKQVLGDKHFNEEVKCLLHKYLEQMKFC